MYINFTVLKITRCLEGFFDVYMHTGQSYKIPTCMMWRAFWNSKGKQGSSDCNSEGMVCTYSVVAITAAGEIRQMRKR